MAQRPDLNGLRVQMYGEPDVYLIDMGLRRHIPNPAVMAALFRSWSYHYDSLESAHWDSVILDLSVGGITKGLALPVDAILFTVIDSPKVFLRDVDANGAHTKRWIKSQAVMNRFQFDWGKINHWNTPLNAIAYPDGPDITWP